MWSKHHSFTVFSLVVALAFITAPFFLAAYQLSLATEILIFALLAMSIDMLAGFAGRVSLCHGAIFGTATYVMIYATMAWHVTPLLAALIGIAAAGAVGAVFASLAVRTTGVYFLLLTLALGLVVWGVCLRWTTVTGGENGLRGNVRPTLLENRAVLYWFVLAVTSAAAWAIWRIVHSVFGLSLRGIRDAESRMQSLGYNVYLHLFVGFVLSALFAGLAGVLYALFDNFVSPSTVALAQSVLGLLILLAGGVGTLFGSLFGSMLVLVVENIVSSYTERWPSVLGLSFILIMIFLPQGLLGWFNTSPNRKIGL